MKRVYFVRHGETLFNAANLVQDESDVLSPVGLNQADRIAQRLSSVPFTTLLTSDYVRALDTAAAIAQATGIMPQTLPLLREVTRPTEFIGLARDSVEYLAYVHHSYDFLADPAWHYSDEENFFDVLERVEALFVELDAMTEDVVAVTHGRLIMFIVAYVIMNRKLNAGIWKLCMHSFQTSNTGITAIEYDANHEYWRLLTFNDHAHFAE